LEFLLSSPFVRLAGQTCTPLNRGGRDAYPTKFSLVIQLKAAKAIGPTIQANIYLHHVYDQWATSGGEPAYNFFT
jgi:hypothetical protein